MNLRIRRRRFGQIVLASAATTAFANFTSRAIAQDTGTIFGFGLAKNANSLNSTTNVITDVNSAINEVNSAVNEVNSAVNEVNSILGNKINILDVGKSTPEINITAFNVKTGKQISTAKIVSKTVQNLNASIESVNKAVFSRAIERLTSATALSDGTFITSSVASGKNGEVSRIAVVNSKSLAFKKGVKVTGLKGNHTVESLLGTLDNKILSIISLNGGIPPFDLAVIDPNTGKATFGAELALPELPSNQRFGHLAQSPDGKVYATNLDHQGATSLVEFNLKDLSLITGRGKIQNIVQLSFEKKTLANDLFSLAFSPSGELYALADIKSEGTNSLFTIDLKTGEMELVRKFSFAKIAFAR